MIAVREAAQARGAVDAAHLIRALVAIAAEPDVTAPAAAMAPQLRAVLPEERARRFSPPAARCLRSPTHEMSRGGFLIT